MFTKIFSFEIRYKLGRPAVYLYFLACLGFTFLSFAAGAMRLEEKQLINGPASLAFFVSIMSLMMMLVSSSLMGMPLYRDIEYNTKEYYLSYPVTKAGYFWGRYLSSFLFVVIIDSAVLLGAYLGCKAGPYIGWIPRPHYGADHLVNYIYPFFTIAVPNLFFSSSLFFGLVAITRNIKVIYSSGILLFLGYMIANFFIGSSSNLNLVFLADPFAVNAVRYLTNQQSVVEKNTMLVSVKGLLLVNRLIWTGVGVIILAYTYLSFSFEKFFSGTRDKKVNKDDTARVANLPEVHTVFDKRYRRNTLYTLTRIELLNIVRDNYFWLIIAGGSIFLGMIFRHGPGNFWTPDFPRTSMILFIFNNTFLTFIFCILIFYTGETIHRERVTRYAFINDALPPSDWVLNLSKFASILCLAVFLSFTPMIIGIFMQLVTGFTQLNLSLYFTVLSGVTLPVCVEMVMLAFVLHICINNKFAALGVGIVLWVLLLLANESGWMDYHLFLYAATPNYGISDFDGMGHMMKPVTWFNIYWLLFGSLLILLGYLFYVRGTISSVKERLRLAKGRFTGKIKFIAIALAIAFISTAAYNYYNVSYLNKYYTRNENKAVAALVEKKLKHFEDLPLPVVTGIKMTAAIYPEQQKAVFQAFVSVQNKNGAAITQLLLDGDNITDYSLKNNGLAIPYSQPLFYQRGKFNLFRDRQQSSSYRLYQLAHPLLPGDSAVFEVNSVKSYAGFDNYQYGTDMLHNGTLIGDGMPGIGYDDDEELGSEEDRAKYGLPKREQEFSNKDDSSGVNRLLEGKIAHLSNFDLVVSTSSDQIAIAPGNLEKQWKQNGRNYYHYVSNRQGTYSGIGFASARYTVLKDSVMLKNHSVVYIELYYQKEHDKNLQRFINAYKDGLRYYTENYGPYPFKQLRLIESSPYGRNYNSAAALDIYNERFGWNANFTDDGQWDYCFFVTAQQLAKQWWQHQLSPNHTSGARIITDGLAKYNAFVLTERRFGKNYMRNIVDEELNNYIWGRGRTVNNQTPLISSNRWSDVDCKAGLVMYGLKNLVGEDSLNTALREFYTAFAYKADPPYAGSRDLYGFLKKHTPDSLQYFLADSWEKVTFYDNKILDVQSAAIGNNRYKITVKVSVSKTYEDSSGNETVATGMNDYIDLAVFSAVDNSRSATDSKKMLHFQQQKLQAGTHSFTFTITGKPKEVVIDPNFTLIDKNISDNIKQIEDK